jgi:hypothetical protein
MKTLMHSLTIANQRILVVALSISLILLSLSCFVFTINNAFAVPKQTKYGPKVGIGVRDGLGYYFDEDGTLRKIRLNQAKF